MRARWVLFWQAAGLAGCIAIFAVLTGCAEQMAGFDAARQVATEDIRKASDQEALAISALRCRPTLGAAIRTATVGEFLGEVEHCGLPKAAIWDELRRQGYGGSF